MVLRWLAMRIVIQSIAYPPSRNHPEWIVVAIARSLGDGASIAQSGVLVSAEAQLPQCCCELARQQRAAVIAEGHQVVAMYCDKCPAPDNGSACGLSSAQRITS
jgi:hypothetical protein